MSQTITSTLSANGINTDVPREHDCINPYNLAICDDFAEKYIYGVDDNGNLFEGGNGTNISYRFIYAELVLSDADTTNVANDLKMNADALSSPYIYTFFDKNTPGPTYDLHNASGRKIIPNYADPYVCANFLGYQRDEIYRFGIIFYNNKNIPSPVHWIGDIRMPSQKGVNDIDSTVYPFHTGAFSKSHGRNVEQLAYALGIEFTLKNIPKEVVSWEIVRCDRTESDRTIVSQGIIGSLIDFAKAKELTTDITYESIAFGENDIRPLPLFNLCDTFYTKFWHWGFSPLLNKDEKSALTEYPRTKGYIEFVSPETCVAKESLLNSV